VEGINSRKIQGRQMSETIDIVLPYVNPMDKEWQAEFIKYKRQGGDKGKNRFRDAGTLPHWFRLIRKNAKFNYRIVLILARESQVPKWLDVNAKDLRIVYHREFIPAKELPTFNSSVINCYIPFIRDLNEKYILFNDDIFMFRPTDADDWFDGDKPRFHSDWIMYPRSDKLWDKNIGKCQSIISKIVKVDLYNVPEHGPLPRKRSLDLFLWSLIKDQMKDSLSGSRFRKEKNVTDWIFSMFYTACKFGKNEPMPISTYYNREDISIPHTKLACYNDTELITDYDAYVKNLHRLLKSQ
jgi:hypothetical protein